MIRYVTPYALRESEDTPPNIADAYNYEMSLMPKGEGHYVAFVDRDTIWLDPFFGRRIAEYVERFPGDYFTCKTNRTNCGWQRNRDMYTRSNDMQHHYQIAKKLWKHNEGVIDDHTDDQLWSGHLMVCPVDGWSPLTTRGLLGVDNEIHTNAKLLGAKIWLMRSVYLYHIYSFHDDFSGEGGSAHRKRDKSHLL